MTAHPASPPDNQLGAALRDFCHWIEEIATEWQNPEELVRLLDLSGKVLILAEDHRSAARSWMRALEISRSQASTFAVVTARAAILESLSRLYHATERLLKALEVERELVSLHETTEPTTRDIYHNAEALTRLGGTLVQTGQFDAGREVLTRADQVLATLGPTEDGARVHARVLDLLATVHRHHGETDQAGRYQARATEMVARPLVPVTDVIFEFNSTVTETATELATLASQIATIVDAIGDPHHPRPIGLARVPGIVATWYHLVSSVENLVFCLSRDVHIIARAAGDEIAGPRQQTLLDALVGLTEWAAHNARDRDELTVLIELRTRVAGIFYDAGDFGRAQTQWDGALEHADELAASASDPTIAAAARATGIRILETRSELAHARDRLGDAIDVETRLFDRHRYADDQPAMARALTRMGATMATATRYHQAQTYLTRADATFQALDPHDLDNASSRADTLELLATVLDHQGHHAVAAQRRQQADELRNLTAHPAGQR